ncbi:hypothetical protein [Nonomuraea candida]|uniref:hypothetical protein n=1 Tax=Nonomuraea candida TaxID=359159 RepID=UPI000A4550F0|nr:hypothetical protein [Nonomuraea candida]
MSLFILTGLAGLTVTAMRELPRRAHPAVAVTGTGVLVVILAVLALASLAVQGAA